MASLKGGADERRDLNVYQKASAERASSNLLGESGIVLSRELLGTERRHQRGAKLLDNIVRGPQSKSESAQKRSACRP
jgi:hypothetical protein